MNLIDAIAEQIRRNGKPIVAAFDLNWVVRYMFRERRFDDKPLHLRKDHPTTETFSAVRRALVNPSSLNFLGPLSELIELQSALLEQATQNGGKLLVQDPELPSQIWRVSGVADGAPEELCCLLDPLCYISHFSAMQRWGLTNRNPLALHLSRPARSVWKEHAQAELQELRRLFPSDITIKARPHIVFPESLRRRDIKTFQPSYRGNFVDVASTHARVATIGQTFWDMVQEPKHCGGMTHVIEVWKEKSSGYVEEIIGTFENSSLPTTHLAFCRAGYLLEEITLIRDRRLDGWTRFGKRGGSSKLDPEAPFSSRYSERWNLSLNV